MKTSSRAPRKPLNRESHREPLLLAGPGQVESHACVSFAHQVARIETGGQEMLKHGNLDAGCDDLDLHDVARAYRLPAEEGSPGEAYNVCSGQATSIRDVLETLQRNARCPIATESEPSRMRPSEVPCVPGSPEKLKVATGWAQKYSIKEALAEMLEYAWQTVRSNPIQSDSPVDPDRLSASPHARRAAPRCAPHA